MSHKTNGVFDLTHVFLVISAWLGKPAVGGSERIEVWNYIKRLKREVNSSRQMLQGLSQAAPNGQGDNLSPSKFREKTRKEAHTKRFISVQKLQAETERGKYILSHL